MYVCMYVCMYVTNVFCTFMPLFETVQRNEFTYLYRSDFPIFLDFKGDAFRTMKQCVHRRYISYNFTRIAMFYLNHLYTKHHYIHCN